jgi:glutathione S-transferase
MDTLHIANKLYSSWSMRPWVLMKELGIPFAEVMHPFGEPGYWNTFSPSGRVPCLHSDGLIVWESLAIVEFLAERHRGVWPADSTARAWARCASAEMHAGFQSLRQYCSMHCGLRIKRHHVPELLQRDIDRVLQLWNEGLECFGGPYLAGAKFTAVDAFFAPVAIRFENYCIPLIGPTATYKENLLGLASVRSWIEAALREPWIDEEHEQEVRNSGAVLEDLRVRE